MGLKGLVSVLFVTLFAFQNLQTSNAANILFFWGMSGRSHRITVWPLVEQLASHGHKITFLSPYPPKVPHNNPNITEFTPDGLLTSTGMDFDPAKVRLEGGVAAVEELWPLYLAGGVHTCKFLTTNPEIQEWASKASYDLVVVNALFNDCGFGYAWKFKAPTVIYSTSSIFMWWGETYGIPEENYPEFQYHMKSNMTFMEEVWNTYQPLYWLWHRNWHFLPLLENMLRPALNISDMPPLEEMDKRASLILTNTHYSEEFARSLPPSIVSVGGMHCTEKAKPLPEKMEKFVQSYEDGFIYFSFGTYMKLPLLPQTHIDAIFGAIRKFPKIGFILKWNGGDVPKDVPSNVFTSEWCPQQDILAHPKVRAFIAHGGLLGTQEAVFNAVPMLVYPIFAEQDYNAERIHSAERGIMLEISDMSEDKLENAIREILTNKKYKENMVKASRIFRDRPATPADTATWWVEYVLRHKDTPHLKPIGLRRTWYERRMLHIWGFIGGVILVALLIVIRVLKMILKAICSKSTDKKDKKDKKVKRN